MPVYNSQDYISQSIESILNQTYKNFELIIVNDGSTDDTINIIKKYNDSRIVLVDRKINKGVVYSLNEGIKKSKGDFIARMDSDDISSKDRFELQLAFLKKNPEIDVCGTFCRCFGLSNRIMTYGISSDEVKNNMMFHCDIAHPTVMMRRSVIYKCDFYNQSYLYAEDYELWCRIIRKNVRLANIPKVLLLYRVSDMHISCVHRYKQLFLTSIVILNNLFFIYKISFDETLALSNNGIEYCIKCLEVLKPKLKNFSAREKKAYLDLCYTFSIYRSSWVVKKLFWYFRMVDFNLNSLFRALKIVYKAVISVK